MGADEPSRRRDPFPSVSHLLTHELDRASESKNECDARKMDTDANVGNTAGGVNVL